MIGGRGGKKRRGEEAMRREKERERENGESGRERERRNRRNNEGEQGGGEDTVARVYRELWLSLVSIPPPPKELPCVHRREEAPAARKG